MSNSEFNGINGYMADLWVETYIPRAGRAPRADGQINVYLHVRTLIHELS
jgi:hypothetical protein